jgi:uncharacterized membrane protein YfcA
VDPLFVIAVVAVGFASGVLSGMFGVGGAVLTTPGLRFLGATPIEAVGSTLPAILPGALSGAWHYRKAGLIDWSVALTSGGVGAGFAVAGAELSDHVDAHYLMLLTAALLLYVGVRSMRAHVMASASVPAAVAATVGGPAFDEPPQPASHSSSWMAYAAIGAGAGTLAGLLGVGGGLLLIPGYTALLRLPPKRAVATSLVAVAMFSVPAMITHAWLGHINWTYALLLTVGVVPGARFGARFTLTGSDARLRYLMGVLFTVLAVVYGGAELAAAF